MSSKDKTVSAERTVDGQNASISTNLQRNANDEPRLASKDSLTHGVSRRMFIAGIGGVAALCALGTVRFLGDAPMVRPPGGQDYAKLIGRCLRCGKCMEACPHQVIEMAGLEKGIISQRTPVLMFKDAYCDWCETIYEVPHCVEVCPTGALELPAEAEPKTTILGIAELNTTTCLAYRDIGCRFCYDACPYEALEINKNKRPVVITEKCNGCGACEAACVSLENASTTSASQERAIVIRPLDKKDELVGAIVNGSDAV